jgi:hypothetical protein
MDVGMRLLVAFFGFALAACGVVKESPLKGETEALLADHDAVTAIELATEEVGTSLVSSDTMTVAPDSTRFPGPCLTVEKTSATSEILHLRGCGTPALRGDLAISWELRSLELVLQAEAHDFFIGSTFLKKGSIRADIIAATAMSPERTMIWESHLQGTLTSDTKPRMFSRDSFKTLRWTNGTPCVTIDGTSTGSIEERRVRVTFTGFGLCAGMRCPQPNSRVRVENVVTNQFIDVRFAPQGRAVVIDVNGKLLPIRPVCSNPD